MRSRLLNEFVGRTVKTCLDRDDVNGDTVADILQLSAPELQNRYAGLCSFSFDELVQIASILDESPAIFLRISTAGRIAPHDPRATAEIVRYAGAITESDRRSGWSGAKTPVWPSTVVTAPRVASSWLTPPGWRRSKGNWALTGARGVFSPDSIDRVRRERAVSVVRTSMFEW